MSNPLSPDAEEDHLAAKSAEDRKAASALANLDADDATTSSTNAAVDQEAVSKAMKSLGGGGSGGSSSSSGGGPGATPAAATKKNVKVDPADVALVVDQLELTKVKATELLKVHDGDAVTALRAYARG